MQQSNIGRNQGGKDAGRVVIKVRGIQDANSKMVETSEACPLPQFVGGVSEVAIVLVIITNVNLVICVQFQGGIIAYIPPLSTDVVTHVLEALVAYLRSSLV